MAGPSGTTTHTYTYDSIWKDQLVRYDGKSISYDKMGNPTNYMGAGMTWDVKGNLTSVSGRNGKSASYTYLSDGQRYTKTTEGKTTIYLYNSGLLLSETTGNEVINYYYDSDGTILGIGYKKGSNAEKHYFFEKNAFGDVIAVYRNSDSVLIGTYEYDLWGNPVSVKEAAAVRDIDGILGKNPFRYRCYYYDTETGFYYLNARYYDPQTKRFISADSITTNTGTDVLGYNLYSYCKNSPVGKADYDGHAPQTMMLELSLLSELGAAWVTFQAAAAGLSVGAAAATGAAFVVCTAATIHNIYVGVKIVNAVVDAVEQNKSEKSSENEKGLNDAKDGDDYLDDESPTKTRIGKQRGKTPRSNKNQNKQTDDIASKLKLSPKQSEQLHHWISKYGLDYKEALEEAKELFKKK